MREASWGFPKFPKLNSEQKTFLPRQRVGLGKTENSGWGAHISRYSDTKSLPCQLEALLQNPALSAVGSSNESGATQAQMMIPQSQQSGDTAELSISRHRTSSTPSILQQKPSAGTSLASKEVISAHTPFDPEEQWPCISMRYPSNHLHDHDDQLSDAWLRYIRKQVNQFTHNIAKRMNKHMFYVHIPSVT